MAVSFSGTAKAEVCRVIPHKRCCALAQCFGILLYCNSFTGENIRIVTESREFAYILPKLFKRAFDIDFDSFPSLEAPGKLIFQIWDPEKIDHIMDSFGFDARETLALHVNYPMVEDECCKNAFLRGAFLAGGSVTDPEKGYHMELSTTHQSVARETNLLIREAVAFSPKMATRGGGQVLYLKQSEQISDLLPYLGAPVAAMSVMSAKMEKDLRNSVNRRLNCDSANVDKAIEASMEHMEAIRKLRAAEKLEDLPEKLKETAALREKYPELTLSELAQEFDPPVTKSCLNHRLRKLLELGRAIEKKEETDDEQMQPGE